MKAVRNNLSKPGTGASTIVDRFKDALGHWRQTSPETRAAILEAMGGDAPDIDTVMIARAGSRKKLRGPAELHLEDGATLKLKSMLPADVPLGYHTLEYADDGEPVRCIVVPPFCYLPTELRVWGWSAQLYALRSAGSWGMGDFADLRCLANWSAQHLGAGILLINPLGAAAPLVPQQASPYYPSSRRYRNLLYLRIEDIPGAADLGSELERLARLGTSLNQDRHIDRDEIYKLKIEALQSIWRRFNGDAEFDRFCGAQGDPLRQFALFCALAEEHGSGWHTWPAEHRNPASAAVKRFMEERSDRVRFHQWIQWQLDRQLEKAAREIPLMQDLPIGVDPDGADAWAWQDLLAAGVSVGSPPDEYNTQGQNWGLPAFVPWKLRQAGYAPFIQTIRGVLRHAGGLRIDHVMGLFRLFWIPRKNGPAAGAYVRYPADELLGILALESHRARAYIVGEDLGTVEESTRKRLAESRVLSYRLIWFESDPPSRFPERALAAVTTHDLPTIAGLWTGSDLQAQQRLGLNPNEDGTRAIRDRLQEMTGVADDALIAEVIEKTHELLAQAPSKLVTATLDDALAVEERPNMPGTTADRWPNWSIALPSHQEDLEQNLLARAIARTLKESR